MPTFQEFLKQRAEQLGQPELRQRRAQWLAAVERLLEQIATWLAESDPDGLLEIGKDTTTAFDATMPARRTPGNRPLRAVLHRNSRTSRAFSLSAAAILVVTVMASVQPPHAEAAPVGRTFNSSFGSALGRPHSRRSDASMRSPIDRHGVVRERK